MELNWTAREQRLKGWLVCLGGVAFLLLGTWLVVFGDDELHSVAFCVGGCAFLVIGLLVPRLAGYGAWLFKASRIPYELEVGPSGVRYLEADGPHDLPWKEFSRWFVSPNLVVLVGSIDALAIPIRCCPEPTLSELLRLVRNGMGEASRW